MRGRKSIACLLAALILVVPGIVLSQNANQNRTLIRSEASVFACSSIESGILKRVLECGDRRSGDPSGMAHSSC